MEKQPLSPEVILLLTKHLKENNLNIQNLCELVRCGVLVSAIKEHKNAKRAAIALNSNRTTCMEILKRNGISAVQIR